jgi:hypothetical protein
MIAGRQANVYLIIALYGLRRSGAELRSASNIGISSGVVDVFLGVAPSRGRARDF